MALEGRALAWAGDGATGSLVRRVAGWLGLVEPRDRPYPEYETETMCNSAWFYEGNYYNPWWREAPIPGPTDYIHAILEFHEGGSSTFDCSFFNDMLDALIIIAPEFALEDLELEAVVDGICEAADGTKTSGYAG